MSQKFGLVRGRRRGPSFDTDLYVAQACLLAILRQYGEFEVGSLAELEAWIARAAEALKLRLPTLTAFKAFLALEMLAASGSVRIKLEATEKGKVAAARLLKTLGFFVPELSGEKLPSVLDELFKGV